MDSASERGGLEFGLTAVLFAIGVLAVGLSLVANAIMKSHGFFLSVPREVWMELGGLVLLTLGGLFGFHREMVMKLKNKITDTWQLWD